MKDAREVTREVLGEDLWEYIGCVCAVDGVMVWERGCVFLGVMVAEGEMSVVWCAGDMKRAIAAVEEHGAEWLSWERELNRALPDARERRRRVADVKRCIEKVYGYRLV